MNGKLFKKAQKKAKKKLTAGNYKFTVFLRDWLETIKPNIAETTYESYSQKLNSIVRYFDTVFPDIMLAAESKRVESSNTADNTKK